VIERPLRQSRGGDEREVDVAVAAAKPGMSEAADEIQTEQVAPEHLLPSLRDAASKSDDGASASSSSSTAVIVDKESFRLNTGFTRGRAKNTN
jgi:hypothetical protein